MNARRPSRAGSGSEVKERVRERGRKRSFMSVDGCHFDQLRIIAQDVAKGPIPKASV